ncbi:hypothetical protein JTB14_010990 [Gonioctena quinquepunctata]|nr:hypothetical protein JTB14_010990 [Gonioctena quinquepunctata]
MLQSDATGCRSSIVTEDFLKFPDSAESEADDASSAVDNDFDYIPPETVDVENENHLQDYDLNFVLTLEFSGQKDKVTDLLGYSDSDWASDVDGRRSVTGYVFTKNSPAVSWSTKNSQRSHWVSQRQNI